MPASTRSASGCATRRATRRRPRRHRCRCASTTCPQASLSSRRPPGTRFRRRSRAQISDAHSGPASGEIHYRRLDSQQWTELPAKFQRGASADSAAASRPPAEPTSTPGTYVFRADAVDAAGNAAGTTRRGGRHRDDGAQGSGKPVAGAQTGRAGAGQGAHLRPPALAWSQRHRADGAVRDGRHVSAAGSLDADGAGLADRIAARRLPTLPRGAWSSAADAAAQTGPHGGFQLAAPGWAPRAGSPSLSVATTRLDAAERGPLTLRVRSGVELRAAPRELRTGEAVHFSGRVRSLGAPLPRRGKLVTIQYYESAAQALAPGARHAQRSRRPLSGRLPLSLRQRVGQYPAPRRGPSGGALALRAGGFRPLARSRNRVG